METFTTNQKKIIDYRKQGLSYTAIIAKMNLATGLNTTPKNISMCLTRSALGYEWDYGCSSGALPYLCPHDLQILRDRIQEAASLGN